MENIINDELLTRYLANEVNTSERNLVERWIALSDTNRQYLDALQQAWQLAATRPILDDVLNMDMEEKWQQFTQTKEQSKELTGQQPMQDDMLNMDIEEKWQQFTQTKEKSKELTGQQPMQDNMLNMDMEEKWQQFTQTKEQSIELTGQQPMQDDMLNMDMEKKWQQFAQAKEQSKELTGQQPMQDDMLNMDMEEKWQQFTQTKEQSIELTGQQPMQDDMPNMDMEKKWQQFAQAKEQSKKLPGKQPTPQFRENQLSGKKATAIFAAAASICLLIIISWQWLYKTPHGTIANNNTSHHTIADSLHHEVNTSGKEKKLTLPDGTLILLANQSALTWREPFTHHRAISMSGKAFFQVNSDPQHPFTVISGDISTTVLGTSFDVNTHHDITVRLYTGKVMITSANRERMKNKIYLSPGQEFIYGKQIIVRSFLQNMSSITKDNHPAEDPYIASGEESNWYMFNNQSLEEVLNQLEAIYKVKIVYNRSDIKNIYFTARYERTESLASILTRIAKLNNLKITDNDSVMIIKK